jgi:hypothetical protein
MTSYELIAYVPVEVEASDDGIGVTLYAAGVPVWLPGGAQTGRLPDRLFVKISEALSAKAVAEGVNMPVALDPSVRLHRCRRCQAPFIAPPWAKLCSDECRAAATKDAALRSKAKRAGRAWRERQSDERGRFLCRQCGKRKEALRTTRRFCSVKCRVAAHRGSPAQPPEPMTLRELDREIYDTQSVLGGLALGGSNDLAFVHGLAERFLALQAERAKLTATGQ